MKRNKIKESLAIVILLPIITALNLLFVFTRGWIIDYNVYHNTIPLWLTLFLALNLAVLVQYIVVIVYGFKLPNKTGAILMCTGIFLFVIAYVGCIMVYIELRNNEELI